MPVPVIEAISRQHRGWANYCLGRIDAALADFDAAARAANRGGSALEAAYSELSRAQVVCELPDPEPGLALAGELRARSRARGCPMSRRTAVSSSRTAYLQQGRLDEADLLLSELVDEGWPRTTIAGGPPGRGCSCSGATQREPCRSSATRIRCGTRSPCFPTGNR